MTIEDPRRTAQGVEIVGISIPRMTDLLTRDALAFMALLQRQFAPRIKQLLERRRQLQQGYDQGQRPAFLADTATIRQSDWQVATLPQDLMDRRVEITGPVERKMIINALNSGAQIFMADFEDSTSPTWQNMIAGQCNLRDANARTIDFVDTKRDKTYKLNAHVATLMVRPRGWHLLEKHILVDGEPMVAGLFDFGLYLFHNAKTLMAMGSGPYFYLPKLQSHLEAQLWNDIFVMAQEVCEIPRGTIKATVLIETLPAAFEMDEILHALREHSAGLNCGRWDYLFSCIKVVRKDPDQVMPDRSQLDMQQAFMRAYTQLVVKTCHRRGVHAIGGMAAQIPIKSDAAANDAAMAKVRADKLREVNDGHDGTWVAHPGLVAVAEEIFNEHMSGPNQLHVLREDFQASEQDLLHFTTGSPTEAGVRHNIRVGVQYLESWLRGSGCVPLYHLMEDAATAEISRAQLWQWLHHHVALDDGRHLDATLFKTWVGEEMHSLTDNIDNYAAGQDLLVQLCTNDEFTEFLTLPAYDGILTRMSD